MLCVLAKLNIPDSNIIIALIGALATFVVVGNYSQVKEIESKFRSEVKQIKDNYDAQTNELKSEFRTQIDYLKSDLRKEVNEKLLRGEINGIIRTFYVNEGLFDDRRRIGAFRARDPNKASQYKMSFIVELDRSFEALKKIRELQNEYGYDPTIDSDERLDFKEGVDKILSYIKKILAYTKTHSLKFYLDNSTVDHYIKILRNTQGISNNEMTLIIMVLISLEAPPDST